MCVAVMVHKVVFFLFPSAECWHASLTPLGVCRLPLATHPRQHHRSPFPPSHPHKHRPNSTYRKQARLPACSGAGCDACGYESYARVKFPPHNSGGYRYFLGCSAGALPKPPATPIKTSCTGAMACRVRVNESSPSLPLDPAAYQALALLPDPTAHDSELGGLAALTGEVRSAAVVPSVPLVVCMWFVCLMVWLCVYARACTCMRACVCMCGCMCLRV